MELCDLISRLELEQAGEIRRIAAASGIPYATLRKIRARETKDPRCSTVEKLRDYYTRRQSGANCLTAA